MKTLLIILLSIGSYVLAQDYEPMILIGKRYANVERAFEHIQLTHNLISKTDTSLTYYGWESNRTYTYIFHKCKGTRYCTSCSVTMDMMDGEEHIGSHRSDWVSIDSMKWKYVTKSYPIPLNVDLLYDSDHMVFVYSYTLN